MTSAPPPATEGGGAPDPSADGEVRKGTVYGFLAYGIWGLFPLYFAALKPAGAWEILGHRILWTLAVCALVLLVRRDLGWIRPFVARPTYDDLVRDQVEAAVTTAGGPATDADLADLLRGRDTWTVE